MPYNTKPIKTDGRGKPIPQYFNSVIDDYEALQGRNGANRVEIYGPDGNPISVVGSKMAVRATELETALSNLETALSEIDTALNSLNGKDFSTAENQGTISTLLGTLTAAAVTDPTVAAAVIALLKGLLAQLQGSGPGAAPVLFPDTAHRQVGNNSESNVRLRNSEQDNSVLENSIVENSLTENAVAGNSVAGNTMSGNNVSSNDMNGNTMEGNTFQGNQMTGINLNEFLDAVNSRFKVTAQMEDSKVDSAFAITPSDGDDLSHTTTGLYIGTAGDLKVDLATAGEAVILKNLSAGIWHPIRATKIYATDTTAADILGAY